MSSTNSMTPLQMADALTEFFNQLGVSCVKVAVQGSEMACL